MTSRALRTPTATVREEMTFCARVHSHAFARAAARICACLSAPEPFVHSQMRASLDNLAWRAPCIIHTYAHAPASCSYG